jgi:hypothetical protein
MKFKVCMGLGVALAVVSTSALAFQEQQGGGAVAPAPAAQETAAEPGKELGLTTPAPAESGGGGTEVRIPGLGKLGVLPKMDFGLELLYGASEAKQPEASPEGSADDLTIRGSLKHNF